MAREKKDNSPKIKLPKTLAQCADRLFDVKAERLAESKKLEPLKQEETALKTHIIDNLPKSLASGIAGKKARVTVTKNTVPSVKDWEAFYKWIKKTGNFHVLGKSINAEAIEEIWAASKKGVKAVPGVEAFTVVGLSLNKI